MYTNLNPQALVIGAVDAAVYWTADGIKAMRRDEHGGYCDCSRQATLLLDCMAEKRLLLNATAESLRDAIGVWGNRQRVLQWLIGGMDSTIKEATRHLNMELAEEALSGANADFALARLFGCPVPTCADLDGAIRLSKKFQRCHELYRQMAAVRPYIQPLGRILQELLYFGLDDGAPADKTYRALVDAGVLAKVASYLAVDDYTSLDALVLEFDGNSELRAICPRLEDVLNTFCQSVKSAYNAPTRYPLVDTYDETVVIKIIGIGNGGSNAVNNMVHNGVVGMEFVCANTDAQALRRLNVDTIIQLGVELTKGLGAGTNPEIGKHAAEENNDRIKEVLQGADMVFLTAGMGGGTGTGAIPVIAQIAREMGILTVAVVTKPFLFEGKKKQAVAEQGIIELEKYVDSLITIPNQKLLPVLGNNVSLRNAFEAANDVLLDAVQGITELIVNPGMINVDFDDVRAVMSGMGAAIIGMGSASGEHRAREAAEKAIACPLLEDINLQVARGILVNISATDMGVAEFNEVGNIVHEFASEDAIIKIGMAIDPTLGDEIKVTVLATGMGAPPLAVKVPVKMMQKLAANSGKNENRETRFGAQAKKEIDLDYLDIPAFLRRQAD